MRTLLKFCGVVLAVAAAAGPAQAERLFGLTAGNAIVTFDSDTPGTVLTSGAISGLGTNVLTGIDLRPATRQLYSLSTTGNLFQIVKNASGRDFTATLVGNISTGFNGNRFGTDFNPVPDRLRFVTDFDNNLRINPATGATIVDGTISAPGAEALVGVAYTNSRAGATTTTLYALDASGNELLRSDNPNAGTYVNTNLAGVAFGPLGVTLGGGNSVGFDISGGTGDAFFNVGSSLYALNLTTGAATSIGTVGAGSLIGLTAASVPEPAAWALMIGGFGLVGAAMRRRGIATVAA
ncbi:DUF4394 domain-containing protein [Glacieibacterium frigidum]|uniref:DUF4394 domain-containing protein n=1 Tax=Glacieibacterium frigidum TaxID=2593303 RepID=A0A552UAU8_9SPHN|nr:DUF4394 domain-containing protein [Glacieibacterium frigidum]TRW15343.1 DUF4394 domain-containing protein [Glacieibacterium frigidum]